MNEFFKEISEQEKEELLKNSHQKKYKKGDVIFYKGDKALKFYVVIEGEVTIENHSIDGKSHGLNKLKEGSILGEVSALDGKAFTATSVANTDCTLRLIEKEYFISTVLNRPELAKKFLVHLCNLFRWNTELVEALAFHELKERVILKLLNLSSENNKINISQQEFANIVSASREKTNKCLQELQKGKWIFLERNTITILNKSGLTKILREKGIVE